MEQVTLKNVKICLNTKNTFYSMTCGGQNSNLYLNVVYFINFSVNYTNVAALDGCYPA
jgi:hypothetical protein